MDGPAVAVRRRPELARAIVGRALLCSEAYLYRWFFSVCPAGRWQLLLPMLRCPHRVADGSAAGAASSARGGGVRGAGARLGAASAGMVASGVRAGVAAAGSGRVGVPRRVVDAWA